jgi:hypothetical protein
MLMKLPGTTSAGTLPEKRNVIWAVRLLHDALVRDPAFEVAALKIVASGDPGWVVVTAGWERTAIEAPAMALPTISCTRPSYLN